MFRTLALSAVAAIGLTLMPNHATPAGAAPTIAPKIATPDNAVQQVQHRGRGGYRGGFHGGRVTAFRGGHRHYGRVYGGRHYYAGRRHYYPWYGHRHRHYHRPRIVIGAGLPFFYGGYYYGGYGYYGGCGHYYRKWRYTGSRYWRNRYYACRWW